jgi:hypothetical protein
MPTIRLILEDGPGNQAQKHSTLAGDLDSPDDADEALEELKNQALPRIEEQLLCQAQGRTRAGEKNSA